MKRGIDQPRVGAQALARLAMSLSMMGLAAPALGLDDVEAGFGVTFGATIVADFEASPTLDTNLPDLFGGSNGLVGETHPGVANDQMTFREIYRGLGESGTSEFEIDYLGDANLNSGSLRLELLAKDHINASASHWSAVGGVSHWEYIELRGPTDPSGNYVVEFTANLGSVTATNTQPPGFTAIWKANVRTNLYVTPDEPGYDELHLQTFALLKKDCPTLAGPACWQISRRKVATGDVTVPGSNPILRIGHGLSIIVASADADAGNASISMRLPTGVTAVAHTPVPEPGSSIGGLTVLGVIAGIRGLRPRSFGHRPARDRA